MAESDHTPNPGAPAPGQPERAPYYGPQTKFEVTVAGYTMTEGQRRAVRHHFHALLDGIAIPSKETYISLANEGGISTCVQSVGINPLEDPAVYVRCRTINEDSVEGTAETLAALRDAGWQE